MNLHRFGSAELTGCRVLRAAVPPAAAPSDDGLDELQLRPQRLVLLAAAGDLQLQDGVAVVHQPADLRHRGSGQRLHDGRQLGLEPLQAAHSGGETSSDLSSSSSVRPAGWDPATSSFLWATKPFLKPKSGSPAHGKRPDAADVVWTSLLCAEFSK